MKKIYVYNDKNQNEYLFTKQVQDDYEIFPPLTDIAPPQATEGMVWTFDEETNSWDSQIVDHRGQYAYYIKDSLKSKKVVLAGQVTGEFILIEPPDFQYSYYFDDTLNQWKLKQSLVKTVQYITPDKDGNINLDDFVKTVDNVGVQIGSNDNNVNLKSVKSVEGTYPDTDGNVLLTNVVKTVQEQQPDENGNVLLTNVVKSVQNRSPDESGNVSLNVVYSVQGKGPDSNGNVSLDNVLSEFVKTVSNKPPDDSGNVMLEVVDSINGATGVLSIQIDGQSPGLQSSPTSSGTTILSYATNSIKSINGHTPNSDGSLQITFEDTTSVKAISTDGGVTFQPGENGVVDIPGLAVYPQFWPLGAEMVLTVDGVYADGSGNIELNAVRFINSTEPDSDGNIKIMVDGNTANVGTEDIITEDEQGNEITTTTTVLNFYSNGIKKVCGYEPGNDGNLTILVQGIEPTVEQGVQGTLMLNFDFPCYKKINGVSADKYGNLKIKVDGKNPTTSTEKETIINGSGQAETITTTVLKFQTDGVKTIQGYSPDSSGNILLSNVVRTVQGVAPVSGDVVLNCFARTVQGIAPIKETGNVSLGNTFIRTISKLASDEDGNFDLKVNNIPPSPNGNIVLSCVTTICGNSPDDQGDMILTVDGVEPQAIVIDIVDKAGVTTGQTITKYNFKTNSIKTICGNSPDDKGNIIITVDGNQPSVFNITDETTNITTKTYNFKSVGVKTICGNLPDDQGNMIVKVDGNLPQVIETIVEKIDEITGETISVTTNTYNFKSGGIKTICGNSPDNQGNIIITVDGVQPSVVITTVDTTDEITGNIYSVVTTTYNFKTNSIKTICGNSPDNQGDMILTVDGNSPQVITTTVNTTDEITGEIISVETKTYNFKTNSIKTICGNSPDTNGNIIITVDGNQPQVVQQILGETIIKYNFKSGGIKSINNWVADDDGNLDISILVQNILLISESGDENKFLNEQGNFVAVSSGSSALKDLTDVNIDDTNVDSRQLLTGDGTTWSNSVNITDEVSIALYPTTTDRGQLSYFEVEANFTDSSYDNSQYFYFTKYYYYDGSDISGISFDNDFEQGYQAFIESQSNQEELRFWNKFASQFILIPVNGTIANINSNIDGEYNIKNAGGTIIGTAIIRNSSTLLHKQGANPNEILDAFSTIELFTNDYFNSVKDGKITPKLATTSVKGVASFNSNQFSASSGAVSLKTTTNKTAGTTYKNYVDYVKERWTSSDGTAWYRLWASGWLEQGGLDTQGIVNRTVSLNKNFADTNYQIQTTYCGADTSVSGTHVAMVIPESTTTTSFQLRCRYSAGSSTGVSTGNYFWYACGFSA